MTIRALRTTHHYTWRQIAADAAKRGWIKPDLSGNQLVGMDLCGMAADYLGEDMYDEDWN